MPKAAAEKGEAVCANAECRAQLVHPLLHCARCKAVAYCSKGVGRRAEGALSFLLICLSAWHALAGMHAMCAL